jgi:hypothetical protein
MVARVNRIGLKVTFMFYLSSRYSFNINIEDDRGGEIESRCPRHHESMAGFKRRPTLNILGQVMCAS